VVNGDLPHVPRSLRNVGGFVDDWFDGAGPVRAAGEGLPRPL